MTEEKKVGQEEWNEELYSLVSEIYVTRQSTITDETRSRYHALFEQVQTKSSVAGLLQSLRALLVLDSRQRLPAGARAGAVATSNLARSRARCLR